MDDPASSGPSRPRTWFGGRAPQRVCRVLAAAGLLALLISIPSFRQQVDHSAGAPRQTASPDLADGPLTLEGYIRCLADHLELDESLALALLVQESHPTDPFRVGPRGSLGPLQVKPVTLKAVGLSPDARQLPFLAFGGLLYLQSMLTRFSDPETALAAYNMGPVALKQRGYRPYRETRRYVKRILARRELIRAGTFRAHPILRYPVTRQHVAVFPGHAEYPVHCHAHAAPGGIRLARRSRNR